MIVSYSDWILIDNDESCIFDHIDHVSAPLMVDVCKSWSTAKRKKMLRVAGRADLVKALGAS